MPTATQKPKDFTYRPHPHLFEINTWAWLEQLSHQQGRTVSLGSVPEAEWNALKKLGFDFVWLMGVWRRSPLGRRFFRTHSSSFAQFDQALPGWKLSQVVGSPYSIQEYRPDSRVGTWEELDQVRDKLHARGMGLMLDFVPNHTGFDHPWVEAHPEYYVQGSEDDFRRDPSAFYLVEQPGGRMAFLARGKDPYFPPWPDVAQLNYFNPAAREALIGELQKIGQHCDGVRCDMAMLMLNEVFARTWGSLVSNWKMPPREFWPDAIAAVPGFVWMAEVYWDMEWQLQQLGFQFTYDKRLYDRLRGAPPQEVCLHLKADWAYQKGLVRFLENHDEPRSAAVFGVERLPALATLVAMLPGMRFYHQGQFEGRKIHLPMPLSAAADEPPNPAVRVLYEKLLALSSEEVFHTGEWRLLDAQPAGDSSAENLIVYQWRSPKAWKIVVVNLSGATAQCRLSLGEEIAASAQYTLFDELADASYSWAGSDLARSGLYIRLQGYRAHLFGVRTR